MSKHLSFCDCFDCMKAKLKPQPAPPPPPTPVRDMLAEYETEQRRLEAKDVTREEFEELERRIKALEDRA